MTWENPSTRPVSDHFTAGEKKKQHIADPLSPTMDSIHEAIGHALVLGHGRGLTGTQVCAQTEEVRTLTIV